MESKKLLLGAASILALATASSPGAASVNSAEQSRPSDQQFQSGDPLVEFLVGTAGMLSIETVDAGISKAFPLISAEQAHGIPRFLRDLIALGVGIDVREAVEAALVDVVSTSDLSDGAKVGVMDALADIASGGAVSYQIAQLATDGRCDPRFRATDPDCGPPLITGAIGDGYQ